MAVVWRAPRRPALSSTGSPTSPMLVTRSIAANIVVISVPPVTVVASCSLISVIVRPKLPSILPLVARRVYRAPRYRPAVTTGALNPRLALRNVLKPVFLPQYLLARPLDARLP